MSHYSDRNGLEMPATSNYLRGKTDNERKEDDIKLSHVGLRTESIECDWGGCLHFIKTTQFVCYASMRLGSLWDSGQA